MTTPIASGLSGLGLSIYSALGKVPEAETQCGEHGEISRHAARYQRRQMQNARPARTGQPALLGAHAEPQRESERQQRDAYFGKKHRPARLRLVDAMLAQKAEQDRGVETRTETDGERK